MNKNASKIKLGIASIVIFISFFVLSLSCATGSASEGLKSQYPLLDHQEIITSNKDRATLFSEARSYLIDVLSNAEFISSGTTDGDMLSTRISQQLGNATLQFGVIIEIKDQRMRFTTKNAEIITYNGYGQRFVYNHDTAVIIGMRKNASIEYNRVVNLVSKGLNDIANGTSSSDW